MCAHDLGYKNMNKPEIIFFLLLRVRATTVKRREETKEGHGSRMKVCKHRPVYFLFSVPQTHQTPSRHLCAPHSLQTHNTSQLQSRTSPVLLNINISHVRLIISHKFIRFSNISQLNNFGAILLLLLFPSFPRCGCRMIFITRK